nr:LysR family transcriptional regulator [Vibrio sp. Isolate30]
MDAISRRGSFAAAANELDRAPSSLSYQIQKLEQDLDIMIFDRSGHRANFTEAGQLILEQGRLILGATERLVNEASILANGWELDLTIAFDGILPVANFFSLIDELGKISKTRVKLQEEILAGCWESLIDDRADLLVCPKMETIPSDMKSEVIGKLEMMWVAASDHYVHKRAGEFDQKARESYRVIAIADTARDKPAISVNILERQPRMTVTNFAAKVEAITAGLGIGTLPTVVAQPLIDSGLIKQIADTEKQSVDIVIAWRRNKMGDAKSWCIQHLKKTWPLK